MHLTVTQTILPLCVPFFLFFASSFSFPYFFLIITAPLWIDSQILSLLANCNSLFLIFSHPMRFLECLYLSSSLRCPQHRMIFCRFSEKLDKTHNNSITVPLDLVYTSALPKAHEKYPLEKDYTWILKKKNLLHYINIF